VTPRHVAQAGCSSGGASVEEGKANNEEEIVSDEIVTKRRIHKGN